jgi:hypothetical protein
MESLNLRNKWDLADQKIVSNPLSEDLPEKGEMDEV